MPTIGQICNRKTVVTTRDKTVSDVARLMRERHVGSVIVVEQREGAQQPVGIVTDRDVVVEIVALDLDPRDVKVGELMGPTLVLAREDDDMRETLQVMRRHGVRRLPVMSTRGALLGIVASDDLISVLAEDIAALAAVTTRERAREATERKPLQPCLDRASPPQSVGSGDPSDGRWTAVRSIRADGGPRLARQLPRNGVAVPL